MVELLKERLKIATGGKLKPTEVDPEEEERQFTEAYLALKGETPPPPIIPVFIFLPWPEREDKTQVCSSSYHCDLISMLLPSTGTCALLSD